MRLVFSLLLLSAFSVKASPFMTVKERLRLQLWTEGLKKKKNPKKTAIFIHRLPEEIERPLKKL